MNPQQRERLNSVTPPKKKKNEQQSTQTHLNFAEVRDGVVIMRDGSLRMIVLCSPTNYDLKSPQEKDSIEYAYQGFLNGLHFPIQIVIQSRRIDLDAYLEKLEQQLSDQTNPLLAGLMEDYIFNIRDLLNEVNIMDKRFYVVVPYFVAEDSKRNSNVFSQLGNLFRGSQDVVQTSKQYEERRRELIQRTNSVAQGLAQIGIRTAVLRTQEIIELFYNSYNVDESQSQALGATADITTPVVQRQGQPPLPHQPQPKETEPPDLYAAAAQQQAAPQTQQPNPNQQPPQPGANV